ncbi:MULTISPECIES: four helix bundle protein [Nostoc]|uniref:Four helix bundle protein n=1 Tax=Nostoc edaphicum CCNP1411 TaxID=1472755 RepID=A0A7D7L906_9NOSO|nr:four helix bundle protein [Nostoc edaphicum]QMS86538.1 four helix bundle protein [Nostoc edaphicum CCNP1411]
MAINSYRDLKVWQLGISLTKQVYLLTRDFPKSETYGLSSQMQRAAVSIPSNLAEGHARDSTQEFLRFIAIALGSLAELETQLILAEQLEYITNLKLQEILTKTDEIQRMLRGLQKSLKAKLS